VGQHAPPGLSIKNTSSMDTTPKLCFLSAVLLLAACNTTPSRHANQDVDLAAISAFNEKYLQALNDADIVSLSALTDEEHVMIAPGRAPIIGKAANDDANSRAFKDFNVEEQWMPVETVIDHDLAYQRGTFTVVATPRAGGPARTTHGNFLRIYRRQKDGSWRMSRDMFSSDQPPGR
jgi:ketosteroid isomerase-like protein